MRPAPPLSSLSRLRAPLLAALSLLTGCSDAGQPAASGEAADAGVQVDTPDAGAGDATPSDASASADAAPKETYAYAATHDATTFLCKVLNDGTNQGPTPNHVQTRFNILGTDLGVPLVVGSDVHVFFGDTIGYKDIWPSGQGPDSVGHIPLATLIADPSSVCRALGFSMTDSKPSVAHADDPTVERDFAGAYMLPPSGESIDAYVAQPAGTFANMPGSFEVPGGAFTSQGKAYVFYAGYSIVAPAPVMRISYVARWDTPGVGLPVYQILRRFDALDQGALGGHFIQVAPVVRGSTAYLFGTGDYRRTGIYLARAPVDALTASAASGAEEVFDPQQAIWKKATSIPLAERPTIAPTAETQGVGELSATYVEDAKAYVLLYQRELRDRSGAVLENRVVLRFAKSPEGPWTEPVTVIDMADPAFQATRCCAAECGSSQILHCDRAGLYGAYLLPGIQTTTSTDGDVTLKIPFLVSTWDPYDVVAFTTSVKLHALTR